MEVPIWRANQWTGFYMIRTFVMKELTKPIMLACAAETTTSKPLNSFAQKTNWPVSTWCQLAFNMFNVDKDLLDR